MSNFIEIEIGGKVRAFRFGLKAIGDMQHDLGLSLIQLGRELIDNPFRVVPSILYHGHKYETQRRKQQVDFTSDDFSEWLEDFDGTYAHPKINDVLQVFVDSTAKYIPKPDQVGEKGLKKVDDKPKKKLTGT